MNIHKLDNEPSATDVDLAYCRAAIYSALAIGFQKPTGQNLARLLETDNRTSLISAAKRLYPNNEPDLISLIAAFPEHTDASLAAASSCYRELFGHTVRGAVPPYETEYGNETLFQLPHELGDLMGFYHAFGLNLQPGSHERADHISCECEFLMFLALKEGYALEHNDREMLSEVEKAEKLFLRDHLGRFLPAFASKLTRYKNAGFYELLGHISLRFVAAECARLQVPLGAANLGLRPADDDRVPMACGNGAECGAIPGACNPEEVDSV